MSIVASDKRKQDSSLTVTRVIRRDVVQGLISHWIPAFAGMTVGGAGVTVGQHRHAGLDPVPSVFCITTESHWVPAFAGMTSGGPNDEWEGHFHMMWQPCTRIAPAAACVYNYA